MEAEEIARLAVDLERAVRTARAEAEKRRLLEERLAATEARLSETRSSHSKRSRSPIRSPRGFGGRACGRSEREGGRGKPADFHAEDLSRPGAGERGDGECSSLPPPRGATGSTIASRGRSVHARPGAEWSRSSDGLRGKGRPSASPRRHRSAEAKRLNRRPWGSSPPPSPRRKGDGPGASAAAGRRRPLVDGGASSSERKQHRRRHSEEHVSAEKVVASSGRWGDPGWGGDKPGNAPARQAPKKQPGREGRHASVGRREAGSFSSSTEGGGRKGRDKDDDVPTGADTITEPHRERKPVHGGRSGVAQAAAGAAAALRGVDLTAKIAQELRAAVATTPASAVSRSGFSDASRVGDNERQEDLGFLEDGELLKNIWQGTGHCAWDGGEPKPTAAMMSREVADLESDVQHIFQFFAAKEDRKRSALLAADRGDDAEADTLSD